MRLEKLANDLLADRIEGSVVNLYEVRALLNLVMACRLTLEMTGYTIVMGQLYIEEIHEEVRD